MDQVFDPLDAHGHTTRDPPSHHRGIVSATSKSKYQVVTPLNNDNDNSASPAAPQPSNGPRAQLHAFQAAHPQMPRKRLLHYIHRLVVFLLALGYVGITFGATATTMALLRGWDNPWNEPEDDYLALVPRFLGAASIRESPLITTFLNNSTRPVNDSVIYLQDKDHASFTPCAGFSHTQQTVFEPGFLSSLFVAISQDTSYRIPQLGPQEIELIAPIVDCDASAKSNGDFTSGKFVFLTRARSNPEIASVLVVYLSNQQYKIQSQTENGAAAVATLQLVHDMRASDMDKHVHYIASPGYPFHTPSFRVYDLQNMTTDGLLLLQLVPPPGSRLLPHTIETACREGFYLKTESEQSNVNNYHWAIESNATLAVSRWRWHSKSVLHDSWAWVHGIHFFIGMGLLSNLAILCLATYRNFQAGKPWIGDAFVSISTSQLVNGVAVLVSWYVDEFWSLREFCHGIVYDVAGYYSVRVYDMHMRADLLTLYLALCGLIGHLCHERIDPLIAALTFLLSYDGRIWILVNLSSALRDSLAAYAEVLILENASPRVPGQDKTSPMGFWTTHAMSEPDYGFYVQCLMPMYVTLPIPLGYVLLRKVYRYFVPDKVHVQHNTTGTAVSENEQSLLTQKRVLTLFEVATGAALESRFGVVSDFDTCVFIKGAKYASADGIYSTGFVIANKKYLLQTSDYWSIVLMKILRRRFRNIYVYDVNGSTVQQTARLVYPHTLTVQDLLSISVGVLS